MTLLLLGNVVFTVSQAQPTFLPLSKVTLKEGLSGLFVRKVLQDRYGFMWLGTQYGLTRFDGLNAIQFNPSSPDPRRSISGSGDVFDLAIANASNELWAITAYGSLHRIDIVTCSVTGNYPVPAMAAKTEAQWLTCMELKDQFIYVGSADSAVYRFNIKEKRFDRYIRLSAFGMAGAVNEIFIAPSGVVWIFIKNQGILVMDPALGKKLGALSLSSNYPGVEFTDQVQVGHQLLVTTLQGLKVFSIDTQREIPLEQWLPGVPDFLRRGELHCIYSDGTSLLIAGNDKLFHLAIPTKQLRQYIFSRNYEDKKWLTLTTSIYKTGESIWIGSQYGLAWIRNMHTPFTAYSTSMDGSGTRIDHSITLASLNDSMAVACGDDGLYFTNLVTGKIEKRMGNDFYYSAFKGPGNQLIVSGFSTGLHVLDLQPKHSGIRSLPAELEPIKNDVLISSTAYKDSLFFMASQNEKGMYIWDPENKKLETVSTSTTPALKSNVINRLYLDKQERLWIVCDNSVSIYQPLTKTISHLELFNPKTKLPLSIIMDVCESGDSFWLAVYGLGIVELTPDLKVRNIFSSEEGINNLGIYKVFPFTSGSLIASTNNGLSVVYPGKHKVVNYFDFDGLQSSSFEETSGCLQGKDILLGGMNGFTRVDPSMITENKTPPKLFFSDIQVQRAGDKKETFNLFLSRFSIPSDARQSVIAFSAINYTYPEKVNLVYRIRELNNTWLPVTSKTSVTLFGLHPGTYHLLVKAANEDGVWSNPIELELTFEPKWFQTWWFKALLALAFIAIVYLIYRLRISQLRKEQLIRTRLASDLHDDLGSTLNSVKVYANLALMERNSDKYLVQVKDSVQEAITGIRDMIWVLDDKKDTIEHLISRVDQFALPLCEANGMAYKKEIHPDAAHLHLGQEEKRNLYLIFKESVNNAIKYAEANELCITITANRGKPVMIISDNGRGFNPSDATEGNGLKNMRFRASQIKYKLDISTEAAGSRIRLEKN